MFAGRGDELLELERIIAQAKNGNAQHFLLTGERGIGKSSLLLFLKLVASGKISPIHAREFKFLVVEIELDPACTLSQLIKQIASGLRKSLAPFSTKERLRQVWEVVKNIEAAGIRYASPVTQEDHELLDDLVTAFVDTTANLRDEIDGILLLIDEADKAPSEAHLGAFVKIFTDRLSKQQCENVCIGMAGVTGIIQKLRASHESAPRIFTVFSLKPLEKPEREEVVRRGLEQASKKNSTPTVIEPSAVEIIGDLSEGFPHFIQQFAYCAFEVDSDNNIDNSDVTVGATKENGALDQLGEKYFQSMYFERINSNEYRAVLQAMAQTDDPDGWTTKEQIRQSTKLKETTLGNAISTLKDKEIILAKPGEKGVYRLPNRSFAAWIRARQIGLEISGSR